MAWSSMNGEIYKALFLILFILGVFIRSLYAYRTRSYIKRRSLKGRLRLLFEAEGYLGVLLLLGQGITLFAGLVVYLFYTPSWLWLQLPLPQTIRWLGLIIGILGLVLLAWTHYALNRYWSVTIEFPEEHRLITSDPYRLIRHPMYTAHLPYFLSWLLITANTLFLVNYLLTVAIIMRRILREEKALAEKFGEEYTSYMKKTGRLAPPLRIGKEKRMK